MRWVCLLVLVGACGRLGFDSGAGDGGGGGGGGGGDGGGGGGGDGPAIDALISPGCGTTTIVGSDFSGINPVGILFTGVSGNYQTSTSNGLQHIDSTGQVAAGQRGYVHQVQAVSFTDTCAIAEIAQLPVPAVAYVYLRLGTPTNNVEMRVSNGQLSGGFTNGGTSATNGPIPYDAVAHRFLRIRNVAGAYHLEAGPAITQFPTSLGVQSGVLVMPSPSTLEIGLSTTAGAANVNAAFDSVIFLGP